MRFSGPTLFKQIPAKTLVSKIPPLRQVQEPLFVCSDATEHPETFKYDPKEYYAALPLFEGIREHGIDALRAASRKGLFTVVPYRDPKNPSQTKRHEFIYGTKVVYADEPYDVKKHPVYHAGVALHPGSPKSLFIHRGSINPHLGHGNLHAINKWEEYQLIEKYSPGLMSPLYRLGDWRACNSDECIKSRSILIDKIQQGNLSDQTQNEMAQFLNHLLQLLRKKYPQGAFLKHQLGCYTVDSGTMLSIKSIQGEGLTRSFVKEFNQATSKTIHAFKKHCLNLIDNTALIVFECLFNPNNVLISPKFSFQKTQQGYPMEFRVDAIDFEPCAIWPRHPTTEYYPVEMQLAGNLIRDLRKKMSPACHYFSFGADVIFDESGKPQLLEMNPGADSGFLKLALLYNVFVSNLTGKKTALVDVLYHTAQQSADVQHDVLKNLSKTILAHPACNDIGECAIHLRNMQLNYWRKQQSPNAKTIMKNFKTIFSSDLSKKGLRVEEILRSTEQYFDRCGVSYHAATRSHSHASY